VSDPRDSSGGTATEFAYEAIRDQIMTGELPPDQWLREIDLAGMLGVSRTPVREALSRLAAEGLIRHERNRGAQVERWTLEDLDEIFALRCKLEPWGAALAAQAGLMDFERLDEITDEMDLEAERTEPGFGRITVLNNELHDAIMRGSGNTQLLTVITGIRQTPIVRLTFQSYSHDELQRSLAQHREIVHALRMEDPIWAESAMMSHLRAGLGRSLRHAGELTK
jgi:DNA-binding GntR family transcriptional regulator